MSSLEEQNFPEPLIDLADKVAEMLVEKYQVAPQVASRQAEDVALLLAVDWAGQQIYIGRGVVISARDRDLVRDLDAGLHPSALAKKYALTERQIHNIRNRVRAEDIARRQMGLFPQD